MKRSAIILFTLLLNFVSLEAQASFHVDVDHSKIFKIAVERNVVTAFFLTDSTQETTGAVRRLLVPTGALTFNNPHHPLINHHGYGVDGQYRTHIHFTFTGRRWIDPTLLNAFLVEVGFEDVERTRIMTIYANHFAQNVAGGPVLDPLQPDDRQEVRRTPVPHLAAPSLNPLVIDLTGENLAQERPRHTNLINIDSLDRHSYAMVILLLYLFAPIVANTPSL